MPLFRKFIQTTGITNRNRWTTTSVERRSSCFVAVSDIRNLTAAWRSWCTPNAIKYRLCMITCSYGCRGPFSVAGPTTWISLPRHLRDSIHSSHHLYLWTMTRVMHLPIAVKCHEAIWKRLWWQQSRQHCWLVCLKHGGERFEPSHISLVAKVWNKLRNMRYVYELLKRDV